MMITLTRPQRVSLHRKWCQEGQGKSYRQFRKTVKTGWDCVMVRWCGMWLGIEPDGVTLIRKINQAHDTRMCYTIHSLKQYHR